MRLLFHRLDVFDLHSPLRVIRPIFLIILISNDFRLSVEVFIFLFSFYDCVGRNDFNGSPCLKHILCRNLSYRVAKNLNRLE